MIFCNMNEWIDYENVSNIEHYGYRGCHQSKFFFYHHIKICCEMFHLRHGKSGHDGPLRKGFIYVNVGIVSHLWAECNQHK